MATCWCSWNAVLDGGEGDDWLLHLGTGAADGGAGDDIMVAIRGDWNQGSDALEIDGGDGGDIILAVNIKELGDGQTLAQESEELVVDAGLVTIGSSALAPRKSILAPAMTCFCMPARDR